MARPASSSARPAGRPGQTRSPVVAALRGLAPMVRRAFESGSAAAEDDAESGSALLLAVSDVGWKGLLVHADDRPPEDLGEHLDALEEGTRDVADVLRRAVRSLPARQRDSIGAVHLLVGDSEIQLVDARAAAIRSADPALVREAGAHQIGSAESTYGFQPFGASGEREAQRGVYGFASVERTRDYLVALEGLATKLVRVTPMASLAIAEPEDQPFAALDFRGTSATLALADPESGAVICRELQIGVRTLAAALADETSVSIKDALQGLERRSCLPPLDDSGRLPTATEAALGPVLTALAEDIGTTVRYFTYERFGGAPTRLFLSGEAERVRGLRDWLAATLQIPVAPPTRLFDRFTTENRGAWLNLLEGAPKGLLKIGKAEYRFVDGRFRTDRAAAPARAATDMPLMRLVRQPISLASLRGIAAHPDALRLGIPTLAALVFAGCVALTVGHSGSELDGGAATLALALDESLATRAALARREKEAATPPALSWTDRLQAIAEAAPPRVFLKRIGTVGEGQNGLKDQRVVIEGETGASADYLAPITALIDRLAENPAFMREVKRISFDGATVAAPAGASVATFTVTVWLDETKRAKPRGQTAQGRS